MLEEAEKKRGPLGGEAVSEIWSSTGMNPGPKIAFSSIRSKEGQLERTVQDVAIVVDGFTRFSCGRRNLLVSFIEKGEVIGVYARDNIGRSFREETLYQGSVDFLLQLAKIFEEVQSHSIVVESDRRLL